MNSLQNAIAEETQKNYWQTKQDLALIESLKPSITKDGDKWCVLYGANLQEGIAGFGDTPYQAILNFNSVMYKK